MVVEEGSDKATRLLSAMLKRIHRLGDPDSPVRSLLLRETIRDRETNSIQLSISLEHLILPFSHEMPETNREGGMERGRECQLDTGAAGTQGT